MDEAVQYRGVSQSTPRDRKAGKWTAVMTLAATDKEPAKQLSLGTFQTQKEAARQYDKATYIRKRDKARQEGRQLDISLLSLNFPEELTQEEMDKLEDTSFEEFKSAAAGSTRTRTVNVASPSSRGVVEVKDEVEDVLDSAEGKSSGKRVQKKRVVKDLGLQPLKKKASKAIKKVWKPKTRDVGSIKEPSTTVKKAARLLDTSHKWKGPSGWKVRVWQRHGEKGGYDMQIVSPSGEVMRSLKQLEEYLNSHGGGNINEFILPYKSPKRLPKKTFAVEKSKSEGKAKKTLKMSTPTAQKKPPVRAKALKSPSVSEREVGTSGAATAMPGSAATPYSCPDGFQLQLKDKVVSGNVTTEWTIKTPDGDSIRSRPQLTEYLAKTNRSMDGFILPHKGGAREGTRANNKAIGQEPEPPSSPTSKKKFGRRKRKDQGPWVRKVNKKARMEDNSPEEVEPFDRDLPDQGEGTDQANQADQKDIMMVDASAQMAEKATIPPTTSSSSPDTQLITTDAKGAMMTLTSADSQHGNGLGAILLPPATTVNIRQAHHPPSSRHAHSVEPILTCSEKEPSVSGDSKQEKAPSGLGEPSGGGVSRQGHHDRGGVSPNMSGPLTPAPGFKIVSGGAVVPVSGGGAEVTLVTKDEVPAGVMGEAAAAAAAVERELAMSEVERYNELDASLDDEILRKMLEVSRLAQQQTEVRQKVREQIAKAEMEREVEVLQLRQAEAAYKAEIEAMRAQHAATVQQLQQELMQERATSLSLQQRLEQELAKERAGGRAHIAELKASLGSARAEQKRSEAEQQTLRQARAAGVKDELDAAKEKAQAEVGELLATRDRLTQENGRLADERDKLQSLLNAQDKHVGSSANVNGTDEKPLADVTVVKTSD